MTLLEILIITISAAILCVAVWLTFRSAEHARKKRLEAYCDYFAEVPTHTLLSLKQAMLNNYGPVMDWPESEQIEAINLVISQRRKTTLVPREHQTPRATSG